MESLEPILKFVNTYGFPIVALLATWIGLYKTFSPLAKQVVAKHLEAVEALTKSADQNARAVEKISDMMEMLGDGTAVTHAKLGDLSDRLTRIDAREEANRGLAIQAAAAAAAAHARLDKMNAPAASAM